MALRNLAKHAATIKARVVAKNAWIFRCTCQASAQQPWRPASPMRQAAQLTNALLLFTRTMRAMHAWASFFFFFFFITLSPLSIARGTLQFIAFQFELTHRYFHALLLLFRLLFLEFQFRRRSFVCRTIKSNPVFFYDIFNVKIDDKVCEILYGFFRWFLKTLQFWCVFPPGCASINKRNRPIKNCSSPKSTTKKKGSEDVKKC